MSYYRDTKPEMGRSYGYAQQQGNAINSRSRYADPYGQSRYVQEASSVPTETVQIKSFVDSDGVRRCVREIVTDEAIFEERRPRWASQFDEESSTQSSRSGGHGQRAESSAPVYERRPPRYSTHESRREAPQLADYSRQAGQELAHGVDPIYDAWRAKRATGGSRQERVQPIYEERRPRYSNQASRRDASQPTYGDQRAYGGRVPQGERYPIYRPKD